MEGYIMYKVKKKETFIPSSNGKDKLHVGSHRARCGRYFRYPME